MVLNESGPGAREYSETEGHALSPGHPQPLVTRSMTLGLRVCRFNVICKTHRSAPACLSSQRSRRPCSPVRLGHSSCSALSRFPLVSEPYI